MNSIGSGRKQPIRLLDVDQIRPVSGHVPVGSAVHCITGRVWLTQEGLHDDIVLAPRENFVVRQEGLVVLSGIGGPALVYLSPATPGRAGDAVIFTRHFQEAVYARAAELRREELARLAGVARDFVMRARAVVIRASEKISRSIVSSAERAGEMKLLPPLRGKDGMGG